MKKEITLHDIFSNAFSKDYTANQAVADLEKLMNEATLIEIHHGTDSPRFIELQRLIPVQEKLVQAKLDGHPLFEQLDTLTVSQHTDD